MAHVLGEPRRTRRAHARLVLIENQRLSASYAERRKDPRELCANLFHPAHAGIQEVERKGIEMPRPG